MSEALHFVLDPLLVANRVATNIWTRPCFSCISSSNNYLHSQYNLVNEFLQETVVIVQQLVAQSVCYSGRNHSETKKTDWCDDFWVR